MDVAVAAAIQRIQETANREINALKEMAAKMTFESAPPQNAGQQVDNKILDKTKLKREQIEAGYQVCTQNQTGNFCENNLWKGVATSVESSPESTGGRGWPHYQHIILTISTKPQGSHCIFH